MPSLISRSSNRRDWALERYRMAAPGWAGAGEGVFELEIFFRLGAAPAVDGLVIVADHEQVALGPDELPQPGVLNPVGVLELVHQHVAETRLVVFAHGRGGAQAR